MVITLSALAFGLVRGMSHALEPDHLAALSTLVAETGGRPRAGLLLGAAWGAGHTITLVFVGGLLMLLRGTMPDSVSTFLELLVALMLVGLGVQSIVRAIREGGRGRFQVHSHNGAEHAHTSGGPHIHVFSWPVARRPLMVGLMHGLAGSGALTAAVVAELPSWTSALVYMLLFGVGSTFGMALLSGALGVPLSKAVTSPRGSAYIMAATGVLSCLLGVFWAVQHGTHLWG